MNNLTRYDITVAKISGGKAGKKLAHFDKIDVDITIGKLKKMIETSSGLLQNRQSIRMGLARTYKNVKDEVNLDNIEDFKQNAVGASATIYVKDLGPQVSWRGVFITEYGGPLVLYLIFYFRMIPWMYGLDSSSFMKPSTHPTVVLACICHTAHYLKREFETIFIHRFSNGTMPIMNIFKNSAYYWGFGALLGYYVNHPRYTSPPDSQVTMFFYIWLLMEMGNFSIHLALRNLRPAGTKIRKIPVATGNPFTWLFELVTCPNYTYEVAGWACFTMMTSCFMGGVFTVVGFLQMWVWAKGKRRNYIKEFGDKWPKRRTAIVPFLM